jgi:hypothetical protein
VTIFDWDAAINARSVMRANANAMKKKPSDNGDIRPHYDFDYSKMKANRFAGEKKVTKQTFIVLDEDVSKVFSHPRT